MIRPNPLKTLKNMAWTSAPPIASIGTVPLCRLTSDLITVKRALSLSV